MVLNADIAIKYLGHATFLITTPGGKSLLIDPWVYNNPACPEEDKQIGSLDTMLVTHAHFDHISMRHANLQIPASERCPYNT